MPMDVTYKMRTNQYISRSKLNISDTVFLVFAQVLLTANLEGGFKLQKNGLTEENLT